MPDAPPALGVAASGSSPISSAGRTGPRSIQGRCSTQASRSRSPRSPTAVSTRRRRSPRDGQERSWSRPSSGRGPWRRSTPPRPPPWPPGPRPTGARLVRAGPRDRLRPHPVPPRLRAASSLVGRHRRDDRCDAGARPGGGPGGLPVHGCRVAGPRRGRGARGASRGPRPRRGRRRGLAPRLGGPAGMHTTHRGAPRWRLSTGRDARGSGRGRIRRHHPARTSGRT